MKCRNCGNALSNNSAICPICGMLMTNDQLKMRKELNGFNNQYMQRLNKLGEDKLKYNLVENEENNSSNIKAIVIITIIIVVFILIALLLYLSNR